MMSQLNVTYFVVDAFVIHLKRVIVSFWVDQYLSNSNFAAHIFKEVKNVDLCISRAMMTSFAMNDEMSLIILITLLFDILSVKNAIVDSSNFFYLYILRYFMFDEAVIEISMFLLILFLACDINVDAFVSRQIFAFVRDQNLSFFQ